jgi:NAD(P)-dependent dehydrogenase (short-subunit alcohol dehydrogenase family)
MAGMLDGQVGFVTGAGRGIGRAIAGALAANGAAVGVAARSVDQIEDTVAQIKKAGGRAAAVKCDVSVPADVERAIAETEGQFGPLTVLVSNAGITGPFAPIWDADPEEWWRTQEVHVHGAFNCARTVFPGMMERRNGRIIIVASRAAERGGANFSAYQIAKAGQLRMTEALAAEGADHGIRAFVLHPGFVDTQFADEPQVRADAQKYAQGFIARLKELKRNPASGNPVSQVADLCVFLAAGKGDALSGRYLAVDYDYEAMAREADRIQQDDLYTLRLRTLEQPAGPPAPVTPPVH